VAASRGWPRGSINAFIERAMRFVAVGRDRRR